MANNYGVPGIPNQFVVGQAAGQALRREQASTMEELLERLGGVNNRLEGARNQLYSKLEKLRGEVPAKDSSGRDLPDVPMPPTMAGGMLGNLEHRVRIAAQTLDSIEVLMQELNERI